MRQFSVITNLGEGRSLIASPAGDQYFIEESDGSKNRVTVQEAVQLLQKAKSLKLDKDPELKKKAPKKRGSRKKAKQLPLKREEIEAAAKHFLTHDAKEKARFAGMDLSFEEKVQAKADEIEVYLHKICDGRDPRDRTPEIWINIYKSAAKKQREEIQDKKK